MIAGASEAHFTFNFTNMSSGRITITNVHPSCGCTTAQLPPLPWTIAPGTNGHIGMTINIAGKSGTLYKTVAVRTDKGSKILALNIAISQAVVSGNDSAGKSQIAPTMPAVANPKTVPVMSDSNRRRSFQMAKTDRQAVFKGDCAVCHVKPGEGKFGKELYDAACGICHEGEHRATMVPNLHTISQTIRREFWRTWIAYGRPHSLMPAFATTEGGPLTDEQIATLTDYLVVAIPSK